MSASSSTAALPLDASPEDLLRTLLDISLSGIMLLRPLYAEGETAHVVDFTLEQLNPAAQQQLGLPERPAGTLLGRYPTARQVGVFDFYRDAFLSGQVERRQNNYRADGLDSYYWIVAQRQGSLLVVSFSDARNQDRSAVETTLRQSQDREELALAEFRQQQLLLRQVFEHAPIPLAFFRGPAYVVELANPALAELWGHPLEHVLGRPVFEALPDLRAQGFEEILAGVLRTGEPFRAQEIPAVLDRIHLGLPALGYFNISYEAVDFEPGKLATSIIASAVEVTEQVLARQQILTLNQQLLDSNQQLEARVQERTQELAEQQALMRRILELMPAYAATMRGPEHRYGFANSAYQRLVNHRAVPGQSVAEAIPEAVEQNLLGALDQVYTSGQPLIISEGAITLTQADGTPQQHYIHTTYLPVPDAHGQPQDILAFGLDITEQVLAQRRNETLQAAMLAQAQRQAQQRQELFQIFEQTPVAIALLREPDHRIEYYNPAFAEVFPPAEPWPAGAPLHGHTLAQVYPRMQEAGLVELLDRVYTTGESQVMLEMPLAELQPGSLRYITLAYQPYYEQERIAGVAAFAYDATEQVLARQQVQLLNQELTTTNQELHESNRQLLRTNAELDSFIYTASHDLKAPIANIEGLLYALHDELPPATLADPSITQLLDLMRDGIRRFQQTIGHLVSITYLQREATSEQVDLEALVESVRLDLAPNLAATGGQLVVDLTGCPGARLVARDGRSILFNLLSNAIKYRAPERPLLVQLRAWCTAEQLALEVQDNGLGLSPEQQAKLFGLFKRLHTHAEGSGVGLYAIKKIIENASGTISVVSELGVGSTFTIRLPR